MKIAKSRLKEIIVEEIEAHLLSELNPYHSKKDGKLSGPGAGNSYSLSKPATDKAGWDPEKAKKAKVTGKGKLSYRFGMADGDKACGRKTVSGKKIDPKRSCSDYPKTYNEDGHPLVPSRDDSESDRLDKLGYTHHLRALGKGILRLDEEPDEDVFISARDLIQVLNNLIRDHDEAPAAEQLQEDANSEMNKRCRAMGFTTTQEAQQGVLKSLNAFALAQDGKLYAKDVK